MSSKNETTTLLLSLVVTLAILGLGAWWLLGRGEQGFEFVNPLGNRSSVSRGAVAERMSRGERILVSTKSSPQKQAGVNAIASGRYDEAVAELESSLRNDPNDPEALIYLNNARIGTSQAHTIAVAVPVGSDVNAAQEILRGVAQAQNEVNTGGGINGTPLRVFIANDDNNPDIAQQVARELVNNSEVLGVVGHYASGVTLATSDIYNRGELVAISPISTSVELSGRSAYIFRTVPSDYVAARALAGYMLQSLNQNSVAVYFNSNSAYSQSLKSEFATAVSLGGGQVVSEFDLSSPNFNAADSLNQARQNQATVLMLAPDTASLDRALQVVQVNRQQLDLLGGDDMYTPTTLQVSGDAAQGMVFAVPWHILNPGNPNFPQRAAQLWGGEVNWRTALSYDATQALRTAIQGNPTRSGVQQALSAPNFAAEGASGSVRFLPSGDRNQNVQLVTIESGNRSGFGYDFIPLP